MKKTLFPILLATVWISVNEFVRNEFVLKTYWADHYAGMGRVFPGDPVNGAVWGLWSLLMSVAVLVISRKFSFMETLALGWLCGFVLMWVVIGNLGVLPMDILPIAVPWSVVEVAGAVYVARKFSAVVTDEA